MSPDFRLQNSLQPLTENKTLRNFFRGIKSATEDRVTLIGLCIIVSIVLLGIFGPYITPYDPSVRHYGPDGELMTYSPPSVDHPLGTNDGGQDVLSRLMFGTRATLLSGVLGGFLIMGIGLSIGVTAGYLGGAVDEILMRFTDLVNGLPLLPFAIVLVGYLGIGFWQTILVIGMIMWRANARVFRSQVLQIKERQYVKSAEALGASNRYIVANCLIPNMMGMVILFFAIGTGIAVLVSASLAFLGFMNPFVPSWGVILRNAYSSGLMDQAWWWSIPPGLLISLTVLGTFLIGRGYEQLQDEKVGGIGA